MNGAEGPNFESLTVFFPMWNEEDSIRRAVESAVEVCEKLTVLGEIGTYDILVVDDASTDDTGVIAEELAALDHRIRVVHHEHNRKLGGSMKSGFANSTGELILYTDADLPFDMAELVKAVRLLRIYEADIVSAYRLDRTGEGPRRLVYSYLYNHMVRLVFGMRFRDVNFAFKLVRRSIFDHIELVSEGSFIDVELLCRAERLGYRTIQFGVDYFPRTRGVSTLSSNAVIARIVREMLGLRRDLATLERLPDDVLHSVPVVPGSPAGVECRG